LPNAERKILEEAYTLAVQFAGKAHGDQKDLAGDLYFKHPLRVSMEFEPSIAKIAAVLHDVVEDTDITLDEIIDVFGDEVAEIVDLLTRRKNETYSQFINRICWDGNEDAILIKMADMRDDMDIKRLPEIGDKEMTRLAKYAKMYKRLIQALRVRNYAG